MEGALCRKCANKASNVATTVSEFRQLLLTVKGVAPVVPFTFGQNQQHQFTFPEIALPPTKAAASATRRIPARAAQVKAQKVSFHKAPFTTPFTDLSQHRNQDFSRATSPVSRTSLAVS